MTICVAIMASSWFVEPPKLEMLLTPFQTTSRLLTATPQASRQSKGEAGLVLPDLKVIERLNETATSKLTEIVRRNTIGEDGWQGYDKAEIISARELLDRDSKSIIR